MSTQYGGPETARNTKADHKAAKAYAKAMRPWYKKKRWWLVGVLLLLVIIAVASSGGSDGSDPGASGNTSQDSQNEESAAKEPEMTSGQANALEAGQNYIDIMPFSKQGLVQQLSSDAGDGYSKADATFAANNVDANWNEEAVEAAEAYLDTMPFSEDALIEQLSSSAGDKFTPAQARQAANKVL